MSARSTRPATRRSRCATPGSLFGDARLIVVADVDGAKQGDGRRRGGWKAADVEAVSAYLASPAPATVLALVAEELKSSSALWKACAKAGEVLAWDVAKKKLQEWVAEQFQDRGVRAEPDAVAALIQLVGDDLHTLKAEVDKLATWAEASRSASARSRRSSPSNADVPIYELTEAWAARDTARALAVSETLFERESRPRRDAAAKLAGALARPSRPAALAQAARGGGRQAEGGRERLKLHPFYARRSCTARRRDSRTRSSTTPSAARRARRRAQGAEQAHARPRGAAHARRPHASAGDPARLGVGR